MSSSLWLYGLKHTRLLCPALSLGICSTSCPLSWWCHLILCCPLLILPSISASRSFPMSHIRCPKYWSFSISPSNVHYSGWFPLGLTELISLQCKELSKISCMYTYIPSPPQPTPPPPPTPTSPSSRWSQSFLCCIAASHYLSILHMVVWKIFLRGKNPSSVSKEPRSW